MKKNQLLVVIACLLLGFNNSALAAEHGGKEHGGTPAAQPVAENPVSTTDTQTGTAPSDEDIRNAMQNHVMSNLVDGSFQVLDPQTNKIRNLELVRVHERVGKTGNYYYSCADFKDKDSGESLDLDLDVEDKDGVLKVVDVRIHKVDGKERYTYDENDNRIPVAGTETMMEHDAGMMDSKGMMPEGQEHGGKEHGGN